MTRRSASVFHFASLCVSAILVASTAHATTYYVSTSGNNGNLGTSLGAAWRTIGYAAQTVKAGDTVYIQGGNYGAEQITFKNTGYSTTPIVFEGQNGTPVLDYGTRTTRDAPSTGIGITSKNYITLRNIELVTYYQCIYLNSCQYITLDNIYCHDCGSTGAYGYGIALAYSHHCTIKNCKVQDCGGNNYAIANSNYNTADNCQTLGTRLNTDTYATDYYFVLSSAQYNTITNCFAQDQTDTGKGNHGFICKDGTATTKSQYNTFTNCTAKGFEECFSCAHGANNNTFNNCYGDSSNKYYDFANGCEVRDGAHDNTFNNCRFVGGGNSTGGTALTMYYSTEGATVKTQSNNHFNSCIFEARDRYHTNNGPLCLYLSSAQNNTFEKCSFVNATYFARYRVNSTGSRDNTGNTFNKCTIYNMQNRYDSRSLYLPFGRSSSSTTAGYDDFDYLSFTNCNFYGNGFATPTGGNVSFAPIFIDQANGNYLVPFGGISFTLNPAAAVTAGARWRRTGTSTWLASGASETDIMANLYTFEFLQVPGFNTPANQDATISVGTVTRSAAYAQMSLVWVNFLFAGAEYGTQSAPYKTLDGAISAVTAGGTVRLLPSSTATPIRVTKQIRLESSGGTARIGR